jgi:hypothetical protein
MGLPALRRLRDSRNRRPRPRHPTAALEQRALAVEQPRASENLSIYGGLDLRPFCVVAGHLLPPVSTHGENGLNLSPADALLGRFRAFRAVPRTRVCVVHVRARCLVQQHNMPLCRRFVTGATGLEPATSGVTGRVGHDDARRRTSLNGLICGHLSLSRRLRFAWLSHSSNRRLGHEWATKSCLRGQRLAGGQRVRRPATCPSQNRQHTRTTTHLFVLAHAPRALSRALDPREATLPCMRLESVALYRPRECGALP